MTGDPSWITHELPSSSTEPQPVADCVQAAKARSGLQTELLAEGETPINTGVVEF